ncbi:MAG: hypothetical protein BWX69_03277 [Planctomycetes bacterium ADurb.Bin069]|nr:MAG: hypothetical protein BWX69_03277 [Planctomycetes bacterium ADurb.Bin069]
MCDPASAAALLALGGASINVVQTGLGIQAARQQGKFAKDMAEYQSGLERQRAGIAKKNAEVQAHRLAVQRRMETASGLTDFAANGLLIDGDPNSAPNVWEQDMAAETAWQIEELRTQAEYEAWGHNANAAMLTAQGRMARKGAQLEMAGLALSGLGGAASSGAKAGEALTMLA